MIKLFPFCTILFLSSCSQLGLQNTVGCLHVNLDGPTTDSSASGDLTKLPDNYTMLPGEAEKLIALCPKVE